MVSLALRFPVSSLRQLYVFCPFSFLSVLFFVSLGLLRFTDALSPRCARARWGCGARPDSTSSPPSPAKKDAAEEEEVAAVDAAAEEEDAVEEVEGAAEDVVEEAEVVVVDVAERARLAVVVDLERFFLLTLPFLSLPFPALHRLKRPFEVM
jgi:hypothetical protein